MLRMSPEILQKESFGALPEPVQKAFLALLRVVQILESVGQDEDSSEMEDPLEFHPEAKAARDEWWSIIDGLSKEHQAIYSEYAHRQDYPDQYA